MAAPDKVGEVNGGGTPIGGARLHPKIHRRDEMMAEVVRVDQSKLLRCSIHYGCVSSRKEWDTHSIRGDVVN
jgi:hypothetical protein